MSKCTCPTCRVPTFKKRIKVLTQSEKEMNDRIRRMNNSKPKDSTPYFQSTLEMLRVFD
jgi:hypothetical protein